MPMLGLIAAALNCGDDAGLGAKAITLSFSQNNNYHYTYDPAAESPALDGYNGVTVDVTVSVPDRYNEGYSAGYSAGYTAGQSSVPIEPLNVTVNDTYEAQSGGYSPVVVNVPQSAAVTTQLTAEHNNTYTPPAGYDGYDEVIVNVPVTDFPEYNNLIACQQQIAAKLGLEPPYDCEDIEEAIDELDGYTFPDDTEYTDILPIVGTDVVTDKTTNVTIGFSVEFLGWTSQETRILPMDTVITGSQGTMGEDGTATGPFANINGQKIAIGNLYDAVQFAGGVVCRNIVIDSTTGTVSGDVYRFPNEGGSEYYTKSFSYQNNAIIGYGDSSHTFSVKNKE